MKEYIHGAEVISLFCRINMNMKRSLPIRASEMGMLIYISKASEPKTPNQIAGFFKVTKPMVSAMVASMIRKGYLIKNLSETDKRSFILTPTEKAVELVEKTYSEYYRTMELIKNRMGAKDYNNLLMLLEKANTILLEEKQNG